MDRNWMKRNVMAFEKRSEERNEMEWKEYTNETTTEQKNEKKHAENKERAEDKFLFDHWTVSIGVRLEMNFKCLATFDVILVCDLKRLIMASDQHQHFCSITDCLLPILSHSRSVWLQFELIIGNCCNKEAKQNRKST